MVAVFAAGIPALATDDCTGDALAGIAVPYCGAAPAVTIAAMQTSRHSPPKAIRDIRGLS
jgi:hypothetical protein